MTIKYQNHEFKGTAGEWVLSYDNCAGDDGSFGEWWLINLDSCDGMDIAGVDSNKHDAQLIASAPKLIQALIAVMSEAIDDEYMRVDPDGILKETHNIILQALGVDK